MRTLIAILGLLVALPGLTQADSIVINNGSAPPNPANVIDEDLGDDYVYVRSVGCPPGWPGVPPNNPCPEPGAPTEVEVVGNGEVAYLFGYDTSLITVSGGEVPYLIGYNTSYIRVSGGLVFYVHGYNRSYIRASGGDITFVSSYNDSYITLSGGRNYYVIIAYDDSILRILGSDFAVDGEPVPYGRLIAQTGTLTGTLLAGDPINTTFYQGGGDYTGDIILAPRAVPTLSPWSQFTLVGCLIGVGMAVWRRRPA